MAYWGNEPAKSAIKIGDDVILSSHIDDDVIVNADINSSAAIATSKISGALTAVGSHGLATSATTDTTNASNISSGTLAAARVATLNQNTTGTAATVTTAAQSAITSVGTLTSLTVTGNVTLNTGDSETALTFTDAGTNAMHIKVGSGDEIYFGSNNSWQTRYKTDGNVETQGDWSFGGDVKLSSAGSNTLTIESTDNNDCKIELIRTHTDYGDWEIKNSGGELNFTTANNSVFSGTAALNIDGSNNATFAGPIITSGSSIRLTGWATKNISWGSADTGHSSTNTGARIEGVVHATSGQAHGALKFYTNSGDSAQNPLTLEESGNATFAGDINMTGGQKKMVLANGNNNSSSMLRISNRSSITPSWADEYICEIHGSGSGTDSEVLMYLKHHENDADRPILRAVNSSNHIIELGSNQQYKFRGSMSICQNDTLFDPVTPFHLKALGTDGAGLVRIQSTATSSTPEGMLIYYSETAPDNDGWFFYGLDNVSGRFIVRNDGDVENHDNDYGAFSDERIKDNITDANSQWDDIKALRVRNFEMKSDIEQYGEGKKPRIGLIAQEVEPISPSLIKHNKPNEFEKEQLGITDEIRVMKYSVLYMKAIKCLQEAMDKIETLETKVTALENA